ncbi:MAG TPA: T9SS type A sorting domain-containing protein, partial [Chryseolinea sp.]|nr:T9SS type A sorting domain-containing protein [Chryseolinea sp.]
YTAANKTVTIDVVPASLVTPLITWATPAPITVGTALSATQLNATASYNGTPVAGTFVYTPPSGTVLAPGNAQQLSVAFTPSNSSVYTSANGSVLINVVSAQSRVFFRALNLNGEALTIDGNLYQASAGAANFSYTSNKKPFANQTVPLIPTTDANRATMIRSSIHGINVNLAIGAVPAGNYEVWVYVWEDNVATTYSLSLEGTIAQANINSGNAGVWQKLGPYARTVNDGTINIAANGGQANLSGVEIWRVNEQTSARVAEEIGTEVLVQESGTESMKLTAYPNPSSGKVNISFTVNESSPTQLAMYDLRGIRILLLYEGSIQPGKNEDIEIEVDLPDGVYVLQLVNGRHVKHFKLGMAR